MRPSLHFIVVGAGVLVALGNVALASAEPAPAQSQKSAEADQANIASTPKRWLQAVQEKVSSSTKGDNEVGGKPNLPRPNHLPTKWRLHWRIRLSGMSQRLFWRLYSVIALYMRIYKRGRPLKPPFPGS